MGRRRKNKSDEKLPYRVYSNGYSYVWKPTSTESITLCRITAGVAGAWREYEKRRHEREYAMTFSRLWNKFISSAYYSELSPRTQKDYLQHQKKLLAVFGKLLADSIKPEHVRRYMDERGMQSKTQANHEKSSMSRVYSWGYERGYVKGNPCTGVSKFKSKSRERYVTDKEYQAVLSVAPLPVFVAMEIAYLCAARISDVLALKWEQIGHEGIFIQQGKTGKKQIKAWNPRLQAAIEKARQLPKSAYVISNQYGNRYMYKGFNEIWVEARNQAGKIAGIATDFTFHDLKAKGISDYEGSSRDKQLFSGHKTEGQVLIYDRKVKVSPTLDVPLPENIPRKYSK
ncbi:tyrosine-type recombinase/integrase [Escherichia albertii]|uniref:tyrosine-type recombinase/integrase n=1 Tax=Escherichia albertii TaxID=208962 RepID=UPI00355BDD8D